MSNQINYNGLMNTIKTFFNLSVTKTEIFWDNYINTMAADAWVIFHHQSAAVLLTELCRPRSAMGRIWIKETSVQRIYWKHIIYIYVSKG